MRERGILMTGDLVIATREDRKTQTRRLSGLSEINEAPSEWAYTDREGEYFCFYNADKRGPYNALKVKCPYGVVGDKLYVKEPHYRYGKWVASGATKSEEVVWRFIALEAVDSRSCYFEDTVPDRVKNVVHANTCRIPAWYKRSALFMPKKLARLWLEITGGRVERVQDISAEDVRAEGIDPDEELLHCPASITEEEWKEQDLKDELSRNGFTLLWDSINAKPKPVYARIDGKRQITHYVSYPWEDIQETREYRGKPWKVCGNPYVWVVEFKVTERH